MKKLISALFYNIVECLIGLFGIFLAVIPHSLFVFFIKVIAHILELLDNRRFHDARANLDFIYPDLEEIQKYRIIKKCYQNFVFVILQTIRANYMNMDRLRTCVRFDNEEILREMIATQSKFVVISAHFGYWEALSLPLMGLDEFKLAALGRFTQFDFINRLIIKHRGKFVQLIDKRCDAFKQLLAFYKQDKAVSGILVDQNISINEGVEVEFFGKRVTHASIASILSRRFDMKILPVLIDFDDENYKRFVFRICEPIKASVSTDAKADILQATQRQASAIEGIIKEHPSSWFWFHKRFKNFYPEIYKR